MLTTIYAEGGKHHNSWPAQETHGEQTICNVHSMVHLQEQAYHERKG
jgi:hypothetical protein